ncbi:MAG: ATP-binding protein [Desulfurococcaceae archaeon]|nr:ATP-binding protein [Desulfurococcaceae archaeon]
MAIKRVIIRNFKCIKELDIVLAPLTIFIGPNGSGKSSILEALALMSQSATKGTNIKDALHGELVEYEDLKSILFRGQKDVELALGIGLDIRAEEVIEGFRKDLSTFTEIAKSTASSATREGALGYTDLLQKLSIDKREELNVTYVYYLSDLRYLHEFVIDGHRIAFGFDERYGSISEPRYLQLSPRSSNVFLSSFSVVGYGSYFADELVRAIRERLARVYYISAERGSIPWTYGTPQEAHRWVGRRGEHTLEILAELMKPANEDRMAPYEILCERFGIKRVWAGWERYYYLTSNYVDPYLGSAHKLPSLGYGSRQLLPIIAQLAYSEPGSVILIEEPEISLHPGYQRLLPVLFGRAVSEGKQILVTTHSSYFPLSLNLVLEGDGYPLKGWTRAGEREYRVKLSPEDVAIYHVTRDEKEGYTKVEKLELDERGPKKGIPSFVEVERDILRSLIVEE